MDKQADEIQVDYVMWSFSVRAHPFEKQVEAAAAGGFDILSLPYRTYRSELARGHTARELVTIAEDHGIRLDYLDGMTSWTPIRFPPGADDFLKSAVDFSVDDALEECHSVGMRNIVAVAGFLPGAMSHAEVVEHLGNFCQRAHAAGIWIDIEAMAMMGLPTLRDVWKVVREANQPNCGIVFDTWHFIRSGADMELLRTIPRGRIVHVQLADGPLKPTSEDLWQDAGHHRELPGDGELPILEMMQTLRTTQDLRSVGPETLSDKLDKLPAAEFGRLAGQATRRTMKAAGYASLPTSGGP